jgi:Zn-dependent peptidase ImmA (M78 family)
MPSRAVARNSNPLQSGIFFSIKSCVDRLLSEVHIITSSETPMVDIEAIAKKVGIKDILYVEPKDSPDFNKNQHAFLKEIDGEYVILVNKLESEDEQRFSIAHEIEHFISMQVDKNVIPWTDYFPSFSIAHEISHLFVYKTSKQIKSNYFPKRAIIEARSNYLTELETLEKKQNGVNDIPKNIAKHSSALTADFATYIFNKPVSEKNTYVIFQKYAKAEYEKIGFKKVLYKTVAETIKEEIADYFAANLLVPTESFVQWKDKPDNKTACVFGVPEKCIVKRKKYEIDYESEFLALKNISSVLLDSPSDKPLEITSYSGKSKEYKPYEGFNIYSTGKWKNTIFDGAHKEITSHKLDILCLQLKKTNSFYPYEFMIVCIDFEMESGGSTEEEAYENMRASFNLMFKSMLTDCDNTDTVIQALEGEKARKTAWKDAFNELLRIGKNHKVNHRDEEHNYSTETSNV